MNARPGMRHTIIGLMLEWAVRACLPLMFVTCLAATAEAASAPSAVLPATHVVPTYAYDVATTTTTRALHTHTAVQFATAQFATATRTAPPRSSMSTIAPRRAAKEGSRGARFVVDAVGETRVFVHGVDGAMEVSQHAARRITQRGLTVDKVEGVVRGADPFRYFHAGKWKTGYYDSASRVFVGSADRRITTVINDAKPQYIENLRAAQP